MIRYTLILIIILSAFFARAQHYPVYSQYMFNGLAINPAYTGSRDVLSIVGSTRSQWVGFEGSPRTQYLSAHMPVAKKKIGLGIQFINDELGVSKNTSIQVNYSYRLPIKKGNLFLGISGAYQFISSKWEEIQTTTPMDDVFESNYKYNIPNFGLGAYYLHPKFYFGLSCPFILDYSEKAIISDTINVNHLNIITSTGYLITLNKNFKLKPSALLKFYPDYSAQIDINCNLIFNNVIWTGLTLRSQDAIVWLFEYQITPKFRLGYAHDFTFSSISRYTKGSNEFFLRYEFGNKTDASGIKFF